MIYYIKQYFIFLFCLSGFGQVKVADNFDVSLDRLYLGLYGKQLFRTDSSHVYNISTLRFGASVSRNFSKQIKIRSFALMKFETKEVTKSSGSFEIVYQPNSSNRLQLGFVGTAFSELRPNPFTPESQTEYLTQSKIPGAKPTLKYFHNFNGSSSITTSFSFNNSLLGYQLKFSHKNLLLGLQLEKYSIIGAIDYQLNSFRSLLVYNYSKKEYYQTLFYSFNNYQFYIEDEINSSKAYQNFEIGVRNSFVSNIYHVTGFIGLAYNNLDNIISCNLFINFKEPFFQKQ